MHCVSFIPSTSCMQRHLNMNLLMKRFHLFGNVRVHFLIVTDTEESLSCWHVFSSLWAHHCSHFKLSVCRLSMEGFDGVLQLKEGKNAQPLLEERVMKILSYWSRIGAALAQSHTFQIITSLIKARVHALYRRSYLAKRSMSLLSPDSSTKSERQAEMRRLRREFGSHLGLWVAAAWDQLQQNVHHGYHNKENITLWTYRECVIILFVHASIFITNDWHLHILSKKLPFVWKGNRFLVFWNSWEKVFCKNIFWTLH